MRAWLVPLFLTVPCAASTANEEWTSVREWPEAVVETAARLPVQDEGRVKPLSTMAAFSLLKIHHKRTCEDPAGNELSPVEWLLDVLFFPEEVVDYPLFRVESYEVVEAVGVSHEGKKKRDLYSYNELLPGRDRLIAQSHNFAQIDAKDRTPGQNQIVNLGQNMMELERLLHHLDFARYELDTSGLAEFEEERSRFSTVVQGLPPIAASAHDPHSSPTRDSRRLVEEVSFLSQRSYGLRWLPPTAPASTVQEWLSPGDLAAMAFRENPASSEHVAALRSIEDLVTLRDDPAAFEAEFARFAGITRGLAERRGELGRVDTEVSFYALDPFGRGLALYLFSFLLTALVWLRPQWKNVFRAALALCTVGAVLHVTGIALRCIVRGRPPISTLYETILFVGAGFVLVCLFMEWVHRRRIAGSLASTLGALSLFLAMKFEEVQGTDTMPQLVAVLDTNFWLATHVTTITLGYSAALLASAFAHVYVLGRVFGVRKDDAAAYRGLARMVYGTLCFALLFSVVGTILGGVWANDSWGRFWGWDPKENGALMIVLSQLAILHGRLGGYIKAFGISMSCILSGCVVAFSWWGVNLLGVGLHSYGFTDGIWTALLAFYALEGLVLLVGMGWWMNRRLRGGVSGPPAVGGTAA